MPPSSQHLRTGELDRWHWTNDKQLLTQRVLGASSHSRKDLHSTFEIEKMPHRTWTVKLPLSQPKPAAIKQQRHKS